MKLWCRHLKTIGAGTLLLAGSHLFSQGPVTFQYFYDDLNQLVKVVDSTGVVIQYGYDSVGNIVQIQRSTATTGALTIFDFTPQRVGVLTMITIQGQGFSPTPSDNVVSIGGVAATVLTATTSTLVVVVPGNAASGIIKVTVGGMTASTSDPLTIVPLPQISSFNPKSALAGTTFTASVTGLNLGGAVFEFSLSATAVISNPSIAADGKSATFTVTLASAARGRYTLVATNGAGMSDHTVKLGFLPAAGVYNTLTIPGSDPNGDPDNDGLTNSQEIALGTDPLNADTDSDKYVDGLEVALGSNPLDPQSIPVQHRPAEALPFTSSLLNPSLPPDIQPTNPLRREAAPFTISLLNPMLPLDIQPTNPLRREAAPFAVSLLNPTLPPDIQPTNRLRREALPYTVSLLNSASGPTSAPLTTQVTPTLARGRFIEVLRRLGIATPLTGVDTDGDGLPDALEMLIGTDPRNPDTDGDGYPDGLELELGSDPLNATSIPNLATAREWVATPFSILCISCELTPQK